MTTNSAHILHLCQELFVRNDVSAIWILQQNGSHHPLIRSGINQLDVDISTRWTGSIHSAGGDRAISRQIDVSSNYHKFQLVILDLHR